jgi:hypothetical protein
MDREFKSAPISDADSQVLIDVEKAVQEYEVSPSLVTQLRAASLE